MELEACWGLKGTSFSLGQRWALPFPEIRSEVSEVMSKIVGDIDPQQKNEHIVRITPIPGN